MDRRRLRTVRTGGEAMSTAKSPAAAATDGPGTSNTAAAQLTPPTHRRQNSRHWSAAREHRETLAADPAYFFRWHRDEMDRRHGPAPGSREAHSADVAQLRECFRRLFAEFADLRAAIRFDAGARR